MAWHFSTRKLADGVAKRRARVDDDRAWDTLELLARGLRWSDDVEESRRLFHAAAVDLIERVEQRGRGDGPTRSRTAGFFRLAGELEQARDWAVRAVDELAERHSIEEAVETLYAGGEAAAAEDLAGRHGVRTLATDLTAAERDGDLARIEALAARLAREIVAGRFAPYEAGGAYPLDAYDWLELVHFTRARVAGQLPPTHTEILQRSGLLGAREQSPRVTRVQPGATIRESVSGPDGTPVDVVVDRTSPEYVEITLDPREAGYLKVAFDWTDADGYTAQLFVEPGAGAHELLPHQSTDFRDAVEAAADWLVGVNDLYGKDATWAAGALRDVARAMPLGHG